MHARTFWRTRGYFRLITAFGLKYLQCEVHMSYAALMEIIFHKAEISLELMPRLFPCKLCNELTND